MSTAPADVEAQTLVDVLRSMAQTLRDLTRDFPTWSLPEGDVGEVIGQAQAVRELSHSLTAVLAREADSRGLGAEEGLSPTDWLRLQVGAGLADHGSAGGLDGPAAAALTRVGAAMNESRWAALAARVAASEVPVGHAAAIIRFHDDVARIADPEHLDAIVASMVEASDVLTARELGRLIAHARATEVGVGPSTLARTFVRQALSGTQQPYPSPSASRSSTPPPRDSGLEARLQALIDADLVTRVEALERRTTD